MTQPKLTTSAARRVGNDSSAPYCCFGDNSTCGNTLVFAVANFYRRHVPAAEKRLRYVKKRFRIPEDTTIHCGSCSKRNARRSVRVMWDLIEVTVLHAWDFGPPYNNVILLSPNRTVEESEPSSSCWWSAERSKINGRSFWLAAQRSVDVDPIKQAG